MKDIEEFVNRVCRSLRVEPALRNHIREELREHLSEAVECHVREGLPEEQAVRRAIEEFGSAEAIGHELGAIHSGNLLSFLMKKAMSWRERIMKTEWKWNFVALTALAFTIAIEVLLGFGILSFLPGLKRHFLFDYWNIVPLYQALFIMDEAITKYWWAAALLIVAGWLLFEFLYRKEGKPNIRLAIFAAVCMTTTLFFAVASLSVLLPALKTAIGIAPRFTLALRSPDNVRRKLLEADTVLSELSDACKKSDWDVIRSDAHAAHEISLSLYYARAANLAWALDKPIITLDTTRLDQLFLQMLDNTLQVEEDAKSQDLRAVQEHLVLLKKSLREVRDALGVEEPASKVPQGLRTP